MLINLSFLIDKPTGLMVYASNLLPGLRSLSPTLLVAQNIEGFSCQSIPDNLTAAQGTQGHLARLVWTQTKLPGLIQQRSNSQPKKELLFSPIPEAPLFVGCRSVVTVHDLIPVRFPRWSPMIPYFRVYIPQVLAQAEHILCNSQATATDVMDFFGVPSQKITPIPLSHNTEHFRFLDVPTQNYFLYIGRCDPHKNVERIVESFATLPDRHRYELWIAGSPDRRYTPSIQHQAAELGVAEQVKFLDYVPYQELPRLINQAIALVFPSLWEGFGIPVLEAMACGTPVITSNLGSLLEVANDAALLVNPYEVSEIASAMHQVATDDQTRSQLRSAGLTRAEQFSWERTGTLTRLVLERYV